MAVLDRWELERACWARGLALVSGCAEEGAGPLACAVDDGAGTQRPA